MFPCTAARPSSDDPPRPAWPPRSHPSAGRGCRLDADAPSPAQDGSDRAGAACARNLGPDRLYIDLCDRHSAVLSVPFLGLAGGALFGPVWGTVCNLVGATLGATAAFLLARIAAGEWVARRAVGRLRRLMEGVTAEWRFVALMRLVPLVPFNLLNYARGLTGISLSGHPPSACCRAPPLLGSAICRPIGRCRRYRGPALWIPRFGSACHDRVPAPVVSPVSHARACLDRVRGIAAPARSRRSGHAARCPPAQRIHRTTRAPAGCS